MRFGTVAIVGRTNVGKSTFLNAALGEQLAIVSPQPQTTRDTLLGVLHREDAQIAFRDTPGLHRPRTELGRRMNASAIETARGADLVLFITDVDGVVRARRPAPAGSAAEQNDAGPIPTGDRELLERIPEDIPLVLVVNKVDLLKEKTRLLPLLDAYQQLRAPCAAVPASLRTARDVERLLKELVQHLPEGEPMYDADTLTDRPIRFFVREYVREQVLLKTRKEVPHAVAVSVDSFEDGAKGATIAATIHVEKDGQKAILIGRGGQAIREIGIHARQRLEALTGKHVRIELFVRVTPRWKDMPRQLSELGYDAPSGPVGGDEA